MASLGPYISIVYSLVETTWLVLTVVSKYFLIGTVLRHFYIDGDSLEESVLRWFKPVLLGSAVLSVPLNVVEVTPAPFLTFVSQLSAVGLLGFVFWRY